MREDEIGQYRRNMKVKEFEEKDKEDWDNFVEKIKKWNVSS